VCAVYTRQSAESGSDFTSCDVQREICVAFGKAKSFEVLEEHFDDHGRSGANLDRPAPQRVLMLVRGRTVRAVVVHRLDRLSRRVADCATLMNEFKDLGVQLLVAAVPELAETASDTLVLNLMSCFAEFEREMIVSRIVEKRASLIARKRRIAGRIPFGYSADQTKQLVPVLDEATIVRQLFEFVGAGSLPSEIEKITGEGDGERERADHGLRARYSTLFRILFIPATSARRTAPGRESIKRSSTRICLNAAHGLRRPAGQIPMVPAAERCGRSSRERFVAPVVVS
jgi:DNA invertase Pin-like site-specific DNA recombinase